MARFQQQQRSTLKTTSQAVPDTPPEVDEDLAAALGMERQSEDVPTLQTAGVTVQHRVKLAERVPCGRPGCKGHLTAYSSHTRGNSRVQFFSCFRCNWKPEVNKLVTTLR